MPPIAWLLATALAAFAPAALAAQEATPQPATATIEPVIWQLQSLTGANGDIQPDDRLYTVQFQPDGAVGVQADCNRGRGTWSVDGDGVSIGRIGVTRMMCPEGSIDAAFLAALESSSGWRYEEDRLVLDTANGGSLTFTPLLIGVTWIWEGVQFSDDSSLMPDDATRYGVTFLPEGKLAIKADCNRGAGSWTFENPAIDLEVGALTRMACQEGSLADDFVTGVNEVSSGVFRNGRLFLALPVDGGIHAFAPRFAPQAGPSMEATPEP